MTNVSSPKTYMFSSAVRLIMTHCECNTCSGTGSTEQLPKATGCTCTSSSCNLNGYTYRTSLPVLSGVVGTQTFASSCQSGVVPYRYQFATISGGATCTPVACSLQSGIAMTITCSGSSSGSSGSSSSSSGSSGGGSSTSSGGSSTSSSTSSSSSGSSSSTITTGYGAQFYYAATDTNCANLLQAYYYPLGVCQVTGSASSGYFYADSNGYIYEVSYSNNACRYRAITIPMVPYFLYIPMRSQTFSPLMSTPKTRNV